MINSIDNPKFKNVFIFWFLGYFYKEQCQCKIGSQLMGYAIFCEVAKGHKTIRKSDV